MTSFNSILIANRGEIAVRVIRTAKALGFKTIAVYSQADAKAPHVRLADDAVLIGPAPVAESYLDIGRILTAARETGAEAVHPGYGFLSENAEFARAVEAAGLVFIGPGADAIQLMGNKAEAKRHMIAAGVPCVPGYEGTDQSDAAFMAAADGIGFPLMVKAAAGGGGRGMRLVSSADELPSALSMARSEALNAFGSDELILEKAVIRPRHVEIQVMADAHGAVIHLAERDCSVQRRHQKVIEEAPSPVVLEPLRARMGQAAVEAARSIGYRGAGTLEFLLDANGNFYFLEMNTRLQVEHPVTELITGLDLVALQIKAAQGEPLGLTQDDVAFMGHAIEVRLYAEDPAQDFLPSTGRIDRWQPAAGEGIRIDSGIETGLDVSPFYDPMLAKIMAWGETREVARRRLLDALAGTVIFGPRTNKDFLNLCLANETFARGGATTAFITEEFAPMDMAGRVPSVEQAAVAAVLSYAEERRAAFETSVHVAGPLSNWSSSGRLLTPYQLVCEEAAYDLTVSPRTADGYTVRDGDREIAVDILFWDGANGRVAVDGHRHRISAAHPAPDLVHLSMAGKSLSFRNLVATQDFGEDASGGGSVRAPMHGKVLEIFVTPGDAVNVGDRLAVLEAMKMQHEILADVTGTVREVLVEPGVQASADDVLVEIDVADE